MSTPLADLAELVPCSRCGVETGQQCVTATGGRSPLPHSARTRPIWLAWKFGYNEGQSDALSKFEGMLTRLETAAGG